MPYIPKFLLTYFIASMACFAANRQENTKLHNLSDWSGLQIDSSSDVTTGNFQANESIAFTYPDGEKGWYREGLYYVHDGAGYWRDHYGVRLDLYNPSRENLNVTATMYTAPTLQGRQPVVGEFSTDIALAGQGWHTVTFPIDAFDWEKARPRVLEAIKTFEIKASLTDGSQAQLKIRGPHLIKADRVSLESAIRSISSKRGKTVSYELTLSNCTKVAQAVTLSRLIEGREVMDTKITPSKLTLEPWEKKNLHRRSDHLRAHSRWRSRIATHSGFGQWCRCRTNRVHHSQLSRASLHPTQ